MKSRTTTFDFVAIFLILAQPFLELVYTNSFIFELANVIILAGCAAAALIISLLFRRYPNRLFRAFTYTILIVNFLDIRIDIFNLFGFAVLFFAPILIFAIWLLHKKALAVLIAVFGGFIIGIFFLPVFPKMEEFPAAGLPNEQGPSELPVYVHIILDEQIGIEALDNDHMNQRLLKQSAKNLFIGNGFRLFGSAYSEYSDTYDSLTSAFNSYRGPNPDNQYKYSSAKNTYTVTENEYFKDLQSDGYDIRVYQTSFLDFCGQAKDVIRYCHTYTAFNASSQALNQLNTLEKIDLFTTMFKIFYFKKTYHRAYGHLAAFSARFGLALPVWRLPLATDLGPIPALPVFDRLISDISSGGTGKMYFAHLLLPHQPYSVDRNCDIRRPVAKWKKAQSPAPGSNTVNTAESRSERYDYYVEQAQCALAKVDTLFDTMKSAGIFDDATVIIQGDHGSRISRLVARKLNETALQPQDFYDGYSALFAVKATHIDPGYDLRMLPLERLLRHAEGGELTAPPLPEGNFVYLREPHPGSTFIKVPMPKISGNSIDYR